MIFCNILYLKTYQFQELFDNFLQNFFYKYNQNLQIDIREMQAQINQQQQQRIQRVLNTILTENDRKIYNIIKDHGCTKNDLKKRTNYPSNMIDKILKDLAAYNLIKSIKKPQSKNLNVWVLYNTTQEEDYEQNKQENQDLMALIWKKDGPITLNQLKKDAIRKGVKIDTFDQVIEVLKMKGEIYLSDNVNKDEKIMKKRVLKTINAPCVDCHLRDICRPDGVVNPRMCPYLLKW